MTPYRVNITSTGDFGTDNWRMVGITYTVSTTVTDTTAPTISSIERYSPSSATTDSQVLIYEVTFSEDVSGVDRDDFTLSPDSAATDYTYIPSKCSRGLTYF